MDPTSREDLSALMDGELAAEPTRFLLRRLDHDPELSATWSRWHLIRACLASDPSRMSAPKSDHDFAARIATALQDEAGPPAPRRQIWARYVGGGAIAAGVAVAALMLNAPNTRIGAPAPVVQVSPAPASAAVNGLAEVAPAANPVVPAWLLSRRPTVLSAQPASANIVYGTGLMEPDYLRRATYAHDAYLPFAMSTDSGQAAVPFVLLPEPPPSSTSTASH